MSTEVHTLDLNFQGIPHVIASYLIRHSRGAVLIETGPGSTVEVDSHRRCVDPHAVGGGEWPAG